MKNLVKNIQIYVLIFSSFIIIKSESVDNRNTNCHKVILFQLLDSNFIVDSTIIKNKTCDSTNYLLYKAQIQNKKKLDTINLILKKSNFTAKLARNLILDLKICKYQGCFKLFVNNENIIDIDCKHILQKKTSRFSISDYIVIGQIINDNKSIFYYVGAICE